MFEYRIRQLRQKFLKENLDGILISAVSNIEYLTGYSNFSRDEREAYIFIGKNFGYIITDGRYSEAIKKEVPHLNLFERGYRKKVEHLFKKHQKEIKKLGIEEDNLTVSEYKIIKKHFKNTKHFDTGGVRSIKIQEEISKIVKACKIGDLAFEFILKKIKAGVTEEKIADELEAFVRSKGATVSFPAIVAFGKNSAIPHHQTSDKRLTINDKLILLDFGVKFENYCSDMTRTVFFGNPDEKQKKMYETVLKAQQKAVKAIEQGERKAAKIFAAADLAIPHSLGHGIGLAVHEAPHISPKSKDVLKEGMVFSIEPGIYLAGFGGVRIEDLFVLEKNGLIQLTHSSKEIICL